MKYESFDALLNAILTDYKNQAGTLTAAEWATKYADQNGLMPDVSMEAFMRMGCQASALWGAYKAIERAKKQIFVDTCDEDSLWHHGSVAALDPLPGETAEGYRARLLERERNPPAGGNNNDYVKWAKEISGCKNAYSFGYAQGLGTSDVVVVADPDLTGDEIPSNSARMGAATHIIAGKLKDTGAAFTTAHAVAVGDLVENPAAGLETTVGAVDGADTVTLTDDIFKYVGEGYIIHCQTGACTDAQKNELIDATGAFDDADYTVKKGDVVDNITAGTSTTVVTNDGAGQLTLADDIFTAVGQKYVVRGLIGRIKKHIEEERPVTASRIYVLPPVVLLQDVTLAVSGSNVNRPQIKADIEMYLAAFIPKQKLYQAQLTALAIQNGAEDLVFTTPNATVNPAGYQMIRPGAVTIT